MGEKFNAELEKIKEISVYNKSKAYSMLDDMATAYLSSEFDGLDKSLLAVKATRKYLIAKGFTRAEINDYLLQRSYISKTSLRKLRLESIYNEDFSIRYEVENTQAYNETAKPVDIIIDTLKSRPELLACLKHGMKRDTLSKKFNIPNTTMLINFYKEHEQLFDI